MYVLHCLSIISQLMQWKRIFPTENGTPVLGEAKNLHSVESLPPLQSISLNLPSYNIHYKTDHSFLVALNLLCQSLPQNLNPYMVLLHLKVFIPSMDQTQSVSGLWVTHCYMDIVSRVPATNETLKKDLLIGIVLKCLYGFYTIIFYNKEW